MPHPLAKALPFCLAFLVPQPALAFWETTIAPDGLAILVGSEAPDWAIVVTCTSADDMSIAYVESHPMAPADARLLQLQADTDQNYGFEIERYRHNAEFTGLRGLWTDYSVVAVQSIGWAFQTVNIHLSRNGGDDRFTRTLAAEGAAPAVDQLLAACNAV